MSYQLLAVDMDGTLLNSKKVISQVDIDAVNRALDAGKDVVFSTGRCIGELVPFFKLFPKMRYALCESGSLIYDIQAGKPIYQKSLDPALVKTVMEYASCHDIFQQILTGYECFISESGMAKLGHYEISNFETHFRKNGHQVADLLEEFRSHDWKADKICLYHPSTADREVTLDFVRGMDVTAIFSETTSLELTAPGADKAVGLRWFCNYLGITPEQVIAAGDGMNDICVMEIAGFAAAVGNAFPEVKAIADAVVADNDHGGVAEIIDRFLL